jgi:hypothetical protein
MPAMATETAVESVATPAATAAAPVTPATEAPKPSAAPAAYATENKNVPPKVPPGYKAKVVNGETRFCRKDTPLGSRFPTEVCMTEAQYQDQERNRDSMRNAIQDRQKSYSINY